ncbi:MAG: galactokinase family protein [Promethearchaeota archaeon]
MVSWKRIFRNNNKAAKYLKKYYGSNYNRMEEKRKEILKLLNLHEKKFGNEQIIIMRTPGRINLMGRHVDHQGGHVNLIAIDKEIFLSSSKRRDEKILAHDIDDNLFSSIYLDFSCLVGKLDETWYDFIKNNDKMNLLRSRGGHWENYFKGVYFRLKFLDQNRPLRGANFCVNGNIPIAAGLSSSSALTIGILESLVWWNELSLTDDQVIQLASEAEWFTGTRGGMGDHVAIKKCKKHTVSHVKFYNTKILDHCPFPEEIELLLVNSLVPADKSGTKRDKFNEKILAYEVGFNLLKKECPSLKNKLNYLRDINSENLLLSEAEILKLLLKIPEKIQFDEIEVFLPDKWQEITSKHDFKHRPKTLSLRKVMAFGFAECERSKHFFHLLKIKNFEEMGKLMYISHDGDRVVNFKSFRARPSPHDTKLTNQTLQRLITLLLTSPSFKLQYMSGGYECSIPEIDFIVDLSKKIRGVKGAQLIGGGMGGCALLLVEKGYSKKIKQIILKKYQKYFKKKCSIFKITPVEGCSILPETTD